MNPNSLINPTIPTNCPICNSPLHWEEKNLICQSENCLVQTMKSVAYFYSDKGMDVKTIGEQRIWELIQDEYLRTKIKKSPWILLDPIKYQIYYHIQKIWGKTRTNNYMDSIKEIKGRKTIIHFIAALGLDGLAYRTAKKIFYYTKYGTPLKSVSRKAIDSFIIAYMEALTIEKELNNFHFDLISPPPNKTYCITGTLTQTREDMIKWLDTKGWGFIPAVTMICDYLIIGENPGRIKQDKAKKYNVKILTEEQLMRILK